MRQISTSDLLDVWESHLHYPVLESSLHLLCVLYNTDLDAIARLPAGERDARLLRFRTKIFGSRLINVTECPFCNTTVEWETTAESLGFGETDNEMPTKTFRLEEEGFTIAFRLPDSTDILQAMRESSAQRSEFIKRCILSVHRHNSEIALNELPSSVLESIERKMSEEDPLASIGILINCPACNKQWEAQFDILTYLWLEINSWAKLQLQETAMLAKAFGWSEKDILNLGPHRRRLYLDLIS